MWTITTYSYTFDGNGNTLTGGGRTNTWDVQNRLTGCGWNGASSTFDYGADGLRRQSSVTSGGATTTTQFVLEGSHAAQERQNGTVTATYLNGLRGVEYRKDEAAAGLDPNGVNAVRWYVCDGLGSVIGEMPPVNPANAQTLHLSAARKLDVYGLPRAGSAAGVSNHQFVGSLGHPSEAWTGLMYMRARYYDPQTGRFASEDGAKHGANWFAYCDSDPVNAVDSNGKWPVALKMLMYDSTIISLGVGRPMSLEKQFDVLSKMLLSLDENSAIASYLKGRFDVDITLTGEQIKEDASITGITLRYAVETLKNLRLIRDALKWGSRTVVDAHEVDE